MQKKGKIQKLQGKLYTDISSSHPGIRAEVVGKAEAVLLVFKGLCVRDQGVSAYVGKRQEILRKLPGLRAKRLSLVGTSSSKTNSARALDSTKRTTCLCKQLEMGSFSAAGISPRSRSHLRWVCREQDGRAPSPLLPWWCHQPPSLYICSHALLCHGSNQKDWVLFLRHSRRVWVTEKDMNDFIALEWDWETEFLSVTQWIIALKENQNNCRQYE